LSLEEAVLGTVAQLKQLLDENGRLKKLSTQLSLDKAILRD
jgi:hypothetical protein